MKRFNWHKFFSDFRGARLTDGDGEEQRYQAFKARFLAEQRQAKNREEPMPRTPSPYDLSARADDTTEKP